MAQEVVNQDPPQGTEATRVDPADSQPVNNEATAVVEEGQPPAETLTPAVETPPDQAAIRLKQERDDYKKELDDERAKRAYLEEVQRRSEEGRQPKGETDQQKRERFAADGVSYTEGLLQDFKDEIRSEREMDRLMSHSDSRRDPKYRERILGIIEKYKLDTGMHERDAYFAKLEYDRQYGAQLPKEPAGSIDKKVLDGAPGGGGTPGPTKSKREQARELYAAGKFDQAVEMHKEAKKEEGE